MMISIFILLSFICPFASLWFRFTYCLHSDTDKDFLRPSYAASPTPSHTTAFYTLFFNALLLLNYFTLPLTLVDCEKCIWCKGPLKHVPMEKEKRAHNAETCDLLFQLVVSLSNRATAAGGEEHFQTHPPNLSYSPIPVCSVYRVHTLRPIVQCVYIYIYLYLHCSVCVIDGSYKAKLFLGSAVCCPRAATWEHCVHSAASQMSVTGWN